MIDLTTLPEWGYTLPEDEPISDETERPPLTGKTVRVPKGMYDQPWSQVHDAYGEASLTPYYIEALGSLDEGDRDFGMYGLYSATTHQGSVYEASRMAIPFLVDMLEAEKEYDFVAASLFLSRIAVGEIHFIETPADVNSAKSIYYNDVFAYVDKLVAFYNATGSEEMMRLLCFYPDVLPDYPDLKADNPELLASKLVVQGFLAAERGLSNHVDEVRKLMYNSPSLMVRGAAAICLAYSQKADVDTMQLLAHLTARNFPYTPWCWHTFKSMCTAAWLYAADIKTLLQCDNYEINGINAITCLIEALKREFPFRNEPYLPRDMSPVQKKILSRIVGLHAKARENEVYKSEFFISSYELNPRALSTTSNVLLRLLEQSDELLTSNVSLNDDELEGNPLWYSLETYLLPGSPISDECICRAISQVDTWQLAAEVFAPVDAGKASEKCSLSLNDFYDGIKEQKEAKLISIFANALHNRTDELFTFLNEWLGKVLTYKEGYDWAFKTPAQRIGIALLAIARKGLLSSKYFPMVRAYHAHVQYSVIPLPIVAELLSHTNEKHQKFIVDTLELYSKTEYDTGQTYLNMNETVWTLLKGCRGQWVVQKVQKAAEVWKNAGDKYVLSGVFPYNDAVYILTRNNAEKEIIYHLPRY